jgi:hypothetical protein
MNCASLILSVVLFSVNLVAIVYGSIILSNNKGAFDSCLNIWENLLVNEIFLCLSTCSSLVRYYNEENQSFICLTALLFLSIFIWDIYIHASMDNTCRQVYQTNYNDLLIMFDVFSIYNFVAFALGFFVSLCSLMFMD